MDPVTSFDQGPANIMPVKDPFVKRKKWFKKLWIWIVVIVVVILLVVSFFVFFGGDDGAGTGEEGGAEEVGLRGAPGVEAGDGSGVGIDAGDGSGAGGGGAGGLVEVPLNLSCESDSYNCGDFESCEEVMVVFDACEGDVHLLDGNKDGTPCESLCVGE